jgi:hypothetical protein
LIWRLGRDQALGRHPVAHRRGARFRKPHVVGVQTPLESGVAFRHARGLPSSFRISGAASGSISCLGTQVALSKSEQQRRRPRSGGARQPEMTTAFDAWMPSALDHRRLLPDLARLLNSPGAPRPSRGSRRTCSGAARAGRRRSGHQRRRKMRRVRHGFPPASDWSRGAAATFSRRG